MVTPHIAPYAIIKVEHNDSTILLCDSFEEAINKFNAHFEKAFEQTHSNKRSQNQIWKAESMRPKTPCSDTQYSATKRKRLPFASLFPKRDIYSLSKTHLIIQNITNTFLTKKTTLEILCTKELSQTNISI